MIYEKTIQKPIRLEGVGLHSGQRISMFVRPSAPGSGITFRRCDLSKEPSVPAFFKDVVNTKMAMTIGRGAVTISTVEHFLAAACGCGIDNLEVDVDGAEIPVLDGSAAPFVELFQEAGTVVQLQTRRQIRLKRQVTVYSEGKWALAEPSDRLEIHSVIEWPHPVIGRQSYVYRHGVTPFSEISSARTFGFVHEVEALKRAGLARGGSLENAVVLDQQKILNPEGLRYSNEFVRHKVLDALGDLSLAGATILGRFSLFKSGHDMHLKLLQAILSDDHNYEMVRSEDFARRHYAVPAIASGMRA